MSLDKIRDCILILAATAFLAFYAQNFVIQMFVEKMQAVQRGNDLQLKVNELEKKLAEALKK